MTVRKNIFPNNMLFKEITSKEKEIYNDFVQKHFLGSIHQTYEWALFQSKTPGREHFKIFVLQDEKEKILGSASIIQQSLPHHKNWWYSPRGPLLDYSNEQMVTFFFEKIKGAALQNNTVFFRFDPGLIFKKASLVEVSESILKNIKKIKAIPAHASYQPEHTLILDLSLSEEDLLKQMKPKGRYNIKVAQKHHIKIYSSEKKEDVKFFYELLEKTTARDKFSGHQLSYYQNMLEILGSQKVRLYLAEYQEKIIAGIMVTFFRDEAIYYFGASGNEYRNTMAPYLLQWQAMKDAKKLGLKTYDFLGIAPEDEPNHPWTKVSDFKLKFGGERVDYLPAQEIVYKPFWYFVMKTIKKIKSWVR